jgi:ACS family hexuronate transporter-like MFS transporter
MLPQRWIAIVVFLFASFLNYLDRQLLPAAGPLLRAEFHLNNEQFGQLLFTFSITYASAALLVGWAIDRIGLTRGVIIAIAAWSAIGVATGFATTFLALLVCRALLGIPQAALIPGSGKTNALYLHPKELALGAAVNQVGLSLAGMSAPFLIGWCAPVFGWRAVFIVAGLAGFLWIPAWLLTLRRIPPTHPPAPGESPSVAPILRDRRFWGLIVANILSMTMYTLWTNWTTLYFTVARGMTAEQANRQFALIPPVFQTAGGILGGLLAMRWISRGVPVVNARLRVALVGSLGALSSALIPLAPDAVSATALICVSFFSVTAMSTNTYAMPIDFFGAGHTGFGVAALTAAYGFMQAFVSPLIGRIIDQYGFSTVCVALSGLPLLAWLVLRFTCAERLAAPSHPA